MKRVNFLCLAILGLLFTACHSNDETDGDWSRSYAFAGLPRVGAVSFTMTVDGKEYAFVGLGRNDEKVNDRDKTLRDFWRFDGKTWVEVDSFPGQGRYGAVAFVIDGKAYVGTGYRPSFTPTDAAVFFKDFWEFNPKASRGEQWSKTAVTQLPERAVGRYWGVAFSLNGKGYVGTGLADGNQSLKDFWCYNPQTDTWTETGFSGDSRVGGVAFVIGNKAVVCLGASGGSSSNFCLDVCIFDGENWTNSPYALKDVNDRGFDDDYAEIPRAYAVAFTSSLDGGIQKGYIATGQGNYRNTCWAYNIEEDVWNRVTELPTNVMSNRAYAVGFTLNNYGYVTLGGSTIESPIDGLTWKFTPGIEEDDYNDYTPQD